MPETTQTQVNIPSVSPLDPDFLLFALPLAAFLDVFGFISIFFSLGIAGFIVSLVLGIPLVIWIVVKERDIGAAKERIERLRVMSKAMSKARTQQAQTVARKAITKKAVKKAMAKSVAKKIFLKSLRKLIIGAVLVFFPYWLWSTVSVLRKG